MNKQPKTGSIGGRLLGRLSFKWGRNTDPWWALVALVIILLVVLVTVRSDPFLNILLFVRDGISITIVITISAFVLTLVLGLVGALGRPLTKSNYLRNFHTLC